MNVTAADLKKWMNVAIAQFAQLGSFFLPQKKDLSRVTVCDFGRAKILLLEIEKKSDHLFLHRFEVIKQSAQGQKPALLLKPFFDSKQFTKDGIRIALKGHGVVIRFIRFPKMKPEELANMMKYEAEQYIPFELKDVGLDFAVVEESIKTEDGEKTEVMLSAIKRQDLDLALEVFRNLECHLSVVDVDILAAMTSLEYFHPEDCAGHVGLLDLGTEISTFGVVLQGKPRFIRDISYGALDLYKRLKTRAGLADEKIDEIFEKERALSASEMTVIKESLAGLVGDLRVSMDYYQDQAAYPKPVEKLYLSGGVCHPAVLEALSAGLQIPVCTCVDSFEKFKWAPEVNPDLVKANLALLPVALGLGIRDE